MTRAATLAALTPDRYTPHALHANDRDWPETNCYVDVWIELLASLGLEVPACFGFPIASDFEGDQWTFFKPPHGDLEQLYGIRVEELTLWRPLVEQMQLQVEMGRVPLVEVDAYWLPDACGTDYRRQHAKTTIGITAVDPARGRLHDFHNRGLHALDGEDFTALFRLGADPADDHLPPYCEVAKLDACERLDDTLLRARATELLRRHAARRPPANPVRTYARRFEEHVALVLGGDLARFHAYGFASVRQLGAAFELLRAHLVWLDAGRDGGLARAAVRFADLSRVAKALLLKLARVASTGKPRDFSASFAEMAEAWERGVELVDGQLAS
jgi:hypothetical protein